MVVDHVWAKMFTVLIAGDCLHGHMHTQYVCVEYNVVCSDVMCEGTAEEGTVHVGPIHEMQHWWYLQPRIVCMLCGLYVLQ